MLDAPTSRRPPRIAAAHLEDAVARLSPDARHHLESGAFLRAELMSWCTRVGLCGPNVNRVTGEVKSPHAEDVANVPAADTAEGRAATERGSASLARGEVAFVVLAGGMATRMGGVVKALVEALPGLTFLDYRLREIDVLRARHGGAVPLWLMTSFATHAAVERAAAPMRSADRTIASFAQNVSLRLTPEGDLFAGKDGAPSLYATGHGDLPEALVRARLLDDFLARGGKTLWIANIDNLGACVDPAILGWHLGHGAPLSVEVVDKVGSDRGGIPARLDGRPVILEEFRLPIGFDASVVRTFNTNTFLVDARALRDATLAWTYFEVRKKVDDREAVQFERLLGELTSGLDTRFLRVPRDGVATRFLPVKDGPELEARRPEIASVASARGIR